MKVLKLQNYSSAKGIIYALLLILVITFGSCNNNSKPSDDMMIRIAELEIEEQYLDEYLEILKEESEASVALEPGVICIYPMYETEKPTQIRLLEIYADSAAYEAHLKTPHFLHYKETTLKMVKSLELIDMIAMNPDDMSQIFKKLN